VTDSNPPVPGPVITRADQLTPAWVQQALRSSGLDVTVATTSHTPLGGTGLIGAGYRLAITYHRAPADAPTSLVVKLAAPGASAHLASAHRKEVGFYAEFAHRLPARTPRCHHAAVAGDGRTFTLLLEDIAGARPGDQLAGCDLAQATGAVRELARVHAPFWNAPELTGRSWLPPRTAASAAGLAGGHAEILRAVPGVIADWLITTGRPYALLHCDFRPDNLMFGADGEVVVLDWQTTDVGLPGRDLGYFLGTGLDTGLRRAAERDLVAAYHAELVRLGVRDLDLAQCFDDYRYGLLQGPLITLLGSAVARPDERGDRMFLTMATRACAAVADHDVLARVTGRRSPATGHRPPAP
jgi:hypothetical protein